MVKGLLRDAQFIRLRFECEGETDEENNDYMRHLILTGVRPLATISSGWNKSLMSSRLSWGVEPLFLDRFSGFGVYG